MDFERYPKVKLCISKATYNSKPTSYEIANEISWRNHGMRRETQGATLLDLKRYAEERRILFPTPCIDDDKIVGDMNLLFFDFDNKGEKYISREVLIIKLKKMNMCPNLVYDTYNSTKDCNRFRIVYVLKQNIFYRKQADKIQALMFELLGPYGVDTNARITGIFFGGYNAEILTTKVYDISLLEAIHSRAMRSKKADHKAKSEYLMLPTANGFAYALNLVDNELYLKIKGEEKVVLRLLKSGTKPVDMEFDDDIAEVNLLVLKALYTMHCRKETDCIDSERHIYTVDISLLVRKTGINFYERKMLRLQTMLSDYNRLVACVGEKELLTVLRNKIEDGRIVYSGRYFDWLKSLFFDSPDGTIPKQHTHNFMLKYEALVGGNMYAELIAEQLLRSVLRCGVIQKFKGISLETLIGRIPQLRHKYMSIKTANEKNIFLGRVLKSVDIILSEKSCYKEKYVGYDFVYPDASSKKLGQITITATEASKLNDFLEDFANYPANFELAPYDDFD